MDNKVRIDGVYFSKEFSDYWVVKKDGEYFLAPTKAILARDLTKVYDLDMDLMRPVGDNVEKLLLKSSDLVRAKDMEQSQIHGFNNIPRSKGKSR